MSRGPIPDKAATRPTVPEVAKLLEAYYAKPGNGVGGSLHIATEDGNIADGDLEFCLRYAEERNDVDGMHIAGLMLQMTPTQRRNLCLFLHA